MTKSYWEKLKDPRWQKRRLEIMQDSGFSCQECGADDQTLNVHHRIYRKGAEPWEYSNKELACLCENCHTREHELDTQIKEALAVTDSVSKELILGIIEARNLADGWVEKFILRSYEHAQGVGIALGQTAEAVIDSTPNGFITANELRLLRGGSNV